MKPTDNGPRCQASDFATFAWPLLADSTSQPIWTDKGFDVGGIHHDILSYDNHSSHWSAELTSLHEADAGRDHPMDLASREMAIRSLRRFVSAATPLILEVGCSSGYFLEALRMNWPKARLIGSDYFPEPLQALAARLPDVPILQFDLTTCPLPDACVDAVTALNVLEHIEDDVRALSQVRRILKPGGIVHIEVPSNPDLYDIYDEQLMHHRRYRVSELESKMRQAGLTVVRTTHLGFFPYPLFAAVKRQNKAKTNWPMERKKAWLSAQIKNTRRNPILQAMLAMELILGQWVSYPAGIRCVVVGQRPL